MPRINRDERAELIETIARERKATALLLAVDKLADQALSGTTAARADIATAMALAAEKWTKDQWSRLAVTRGIRPPSREVIEEVMRRLRARAAQ